MDTGDFRTHLLSKWQVRRATIERVVEQSGLHIEALIAHFQSLSEILEEATASKVEFTTGNRYFHESSDTISQEFLLSCPSLGITWTHDFHFAGTGLKFEGHNYGYGAMNNIKSYINNSVMRRFLPPSKSFM